MRGRNSSLLAAAAAGALLGATLWFIFRPPDSLPSSPPAMRQAALPNLGGDAIALLEELPTAPPSATTPTLVESSDAQIEARIQALARELGRMWTRDSEELVRVIEKAVNHASSSPPDTLLLAIAHAETNGHILDVSEAGAVGLAQATPVAYLQEKFDGKLFVTDDYLRGARAYIMKKPLGDADTIASLVIERPNASRRLRARRLLLAAKNLRREGVDELLLLKQYASPEYFEEIERLDRKNAATLKELGRLLEQYDLAELRSFRDETRKRYRAMKRTQVDSWARYQDDMIAERDRLLERRYGMPAKIVKSADAYAAGEWLGEIFDQRFSAEAMAHFLVVHLERKSKEARALRVRGRSNEELTAALYNGGSHNVRRMLSGLITRLPETEKYMKKVPATRRRLEASTRDLSSTAAGLSSALR